MSNVHHTAYTNNNPNAANSNRETADRK